MPPIAALIDAIRVTPDCTIIAPVGLPQVDDGMELPADVREFYRLCGGASLFSSSTYGLTIVSPERLVIANPVIMIGVGAEHLAELDAQPSYSWHVIGEGPNGMYVTIDLDSSRLGQCYDSYWDVHPHDSAVIAQSFTELLALLLASRGGGWWW